MSNVLRVSAEWLADYQRKHGAASLAPANDASSLPLIVAKPAPAGRKQNKLEATYEGVLELRKRAGEIEAYGYEQITLLLAHDTRYTPDFFVIGDRLQFHEVKGPKFWDDAKVKLKVAARMFPWADFYLVRQIGGEFNVDKVPA